MLIRERVDIDVSVDEEGSKKHIYFILFYFTSSKNKINFLFDFSISKIKITSTGVNTFCTLWRVSQLFRLNIFTAACRISVSNACSKQVLYIFSSPVASVSWELEYKVLCAISTSIFKAKHEKVSYEFFLFAFLQLCFAISPFCICCSGVMI